MSKKSVRKKRASKVGETHKCKPAKPVDERCATDEPRVRSAARPDIDERERGATPDRKAAGPRPRRRRSATRSGAPPTTPDVLPDAIAKPRSQKKKS